MVSQKKPTSPAYEAVYFKGEYPIKIGAAWYSESGKAINVALDLLPPNGRITLVKPRPKQSPAAA